MWNFVATPYQKYIRCIVPMLNLKPRLGHFSHPLLNFYRGEKCEIWPRFSTTVDFGALWFRNEVSCLKSRRCIGSTPIIVVPGGVTRGRGRTAPGDIIEGWNPNESVTRGRGRTAPGDIIEGWNPNESVTRGRGRTARVTSSRNETLMKASLKGGGGLPRVTSSRGETLMKV